MRMFIFLFILLLPTLSSAEELAIQGYDVVAYFTMDKALRGKKKIHISYEGKTYRFAKKSPPMEYVTEIRLMRASRALAESDQNLAEIAAAVGASEFAFSKAFKRGFEKSPGSIRKSRA